MAVRPAVSVLGHLCTSKNKWTGTAVVNGQQRTLGICDWKMRREKRSGRAATFASGTRDTKRREIQRKADR
jgi:hypothetical protein